MNSLILRKNFMFRKKTLAGQDSLKHFDVWIETCLRILTVPLFVENVAYFTNTYHGREYEFSSTRFWAIAGIFLLISPVQLYFLMWKMNKSNKLK